MITGIHFVTNGDKEVEAYANGFCAGYNFSCINNPYKDFSELARQWELGYFAGYWCKR